MEEERTDRAAPRNPSGESQRLRQRAEAMVGRTEVSPTGEGSPDAVRLVHELSVYQIELELQNDELQRANLEAEEARQKYYDLYDRAPVAYVTLDRKGALIDMNLATANLLNQPRGMLNGRSLHVFVAPSDVSVLDAFLRKTFSSSLMNACEVSLVKDGAPAAVVRLEGFRADPRPGDPPLCRAVMFDITERKRAEAALKASEETLRKINEELEGKVAERTIQLTDLVESLQGEVRQRVHSETELAAAHNELRARAGRLRDLASDITRAGSASGSALPSSCTRMSSKSWRPSDSARPCSRGMTRNRSGRGRPRSSRCPPSATGSVARSPPSCTHRC